MNTFSDGALLMLIGGAFGFAIGVWTNMAWCLARIRYWRQRAAHERQAREQAVARCVLLRRQAG